MLLSTTISSPTVVQIGRLKHSWLGNEILNKTAESVVRLRRGKGWPGLSRFQAAAQLSISLADDVERGFSPLHIVDTCKPLKALSSKSRLAIRNAVHKAYLDCFDVAERADELRNSARRLNTEISDFLEEWNREDGEVPDAVISQAWEEVLVAARALYGAFDALPKGIVLP